MARQQRLNQLLDEDGDGIYTVVLETGAGDIEYKYGIDGFADQENLIDDMQNGASCAPITDYNGYANRQVASGSTTNDTYGSCEPCPSDVLGCIDALACNYDASATIQDSLPSSTGALLLDWTSGSYDWRNFGHHGVGRLTAHLRAPSRLKTEPGTYTIEGFDSYGDGWNGASMTFVDIASGNSITLAVEGSSGSVDIEVTAGATLESSCDYAANVARSIVTAIAPTVDCFVP